MNDDLILVDSTVWIHFLRDTDPLIGERLTPLIVADRLATSPIIILEILRGARNQKQYDSLEEDFSALHCLEMTDAMWQRANRLAYTLRTKGVNAHLTDTLIAAAALEHDLPLLHDDRHFETIASIVPTLRQERLAPSRRD